MRSAASITRASCWKSRCSMIRRTRRGAIAESAVRRFAAEGVDIHYIHRADRTGYKAGALEAGLKVGARRVRRHLRRRFHPAARLPDPAHAAFRRSQGRDGAGPLGAHQPGLFAPDEDPVDSPGRPLRARAWRPASGGTVLQFQRDGRHLAAGRDRGRRRLAARHPDRRSRSELPGAAPRVAVRLQAATSSRRPRCRSR